jgi:hypothetical protein
MLYPYSLLAYLDRMVSTRSSSDLIEDSDALALRSRRIPVDSRHQKNSDASHEHGGHDIPRKRRKSGPKPEEGAFDQMKSSQGGVTLFTVMRQEDAHDQTGSSPTTARPSSLPLAEESIADYKERDKALETATQRANSKGTYVAADSGLGVHKRFQSEEPTSATATQLESTAMASDEESANTEADVTKASMSVNGDESAPETLSTSLKQNLHFPPGSREPKSKRRKVGSARLLGISHRDTASAPTRTADLSSSKNNQSSPEVPKEPLTSKSHVGVDATISRKVKDIIKNGVTYRPISSQSLRGETSPWLPAKASAESRKLRERLLVRKRVQKVYLGRRRKFVTSR